MSERAKALRQNSSPAERRMWRLLFAFRTGGYHFRKQAQIGPYVVDIACHHAKLIIEVDGDTHGSSAAQYADKRRDMFLADDGYTVLRFSNSEVMTNPEGIFDTVSRALVDRPQNQRKSHPLPNPPHKGEGDLTETLNSSLTSDASAPANTLPLVGRVGEGDNHV